MFPIDSTRRVAQITYTLLFRQMREDKNVCFRNDVPRDSPPMSYRVLQHFLTGYFIQIRSTMIVIQRVLGFPFVTSSRTCSRMWLLMNDYQLRLITNLQKYCIHIQCWEMLHSLLFTLLDCNKIIKFTRTVILLFLYNDIKNIAKQDY